MSYARDPLDTDFGPEDAEHKPGDVVIHDFSAPSPYGHVHVVTEEEEALYEALYGPSDDEDDDDDF